MNSDARRSTAFSARLPPRTKLTLSLAALGLVGAGLGLGWLDRSPGVGFGTEASQSEEGLRITTSGLEYVNLPYGSTLGYDVGDTFTEGVSELRLKGDKSVTLLAVRQHISQDDILEPLGARVAMPDRPYAFAQELPYFPPRSTPDFGTIRTLEGAVLEPGEGAGTMGFEIFLGYKVTGQGRAVRPGFELDYEVDGKRYTIEIPNKIAVCVPKRVDCPDASAGK